MLGSATPKYLKPPAKKIECTISGAMYWALRISQLLFAAPVRMQKEGGVWRVQYAPARFVGAVIFALLSSGVKIYEIISMFSHETSGETITRPTIMSLLYIVVTLATIFVVGSSCGRLKCILQCLDHIQKVRATLGNNFTLNKSLERKKMVALTVLVVYTLLVLIYTINRVMYMDQYSDESIAIGCVTVLQQMVMLCLILQFKYSVMEIDVALKIVNQLLEHILYPVNPVHANKHRSECFLAPSRVRLSKRVDATIRDLCTIYTSLCKMVVKLNSCTEFGIVPILVSCFSHLTSAAYLFIIKISTNSNIIDAFGINLSWWILEVIWLIALVEPCHNLQLEVDRMKLLVSNLSSKYTDERISAELDYFGRSLVQNHTEFVPLGICTLTQSLVVSIIATSTTYVVIIIQFQT